MARGNVTWTSILITFGLFGVVALWMMFGAARFEASTSDRWSAIVGKDWLLVYEVGVSGSGRTRRFSRMVVLDIHTGVRHALQPIGEPGESPFTISDEQVWTWDSRKYKLASYAVPSLEPWLTQDALNKKYPALAVGLTGKCYVRRPEHVVKVTTQAGDHYQIKLATGEVEPSDGNCDEPKVDTPIVQEPPRTQSLPPTKIELHKVAGSEKEALMLRGTTDPIGPGRWLQPKELDVYGPQLDDDLLIASRTLLNDKGETRLARVHKDGTQAWQLDLDPTNHIRHVYTIDDMMLLMLDPGVRCINAKTGTPRWTH